MAHLTAWSQPGGGHLRHIPHQPPYWGSWTRIAGPPISRSFSGIQEGARIGPRMGFRMDLQRDRERTPKKGTQSKDLKDGFQGFVFRKVVQCRIASYRVALHRIASRCIVSHRITSSHVGHKVVRTPLLKSFRCIPSGLITETAWTL